MTKKIQQSLGFGKKETMTNKEEISSITRQIEQLSKSPPASRPEQLQVKTAEVRSLEVARDENENQQRFEKNKSEQVLKPVVPQPMAPRTRVENSQNSREVEEPPDKMEEKKELDSRPKLTDEKSKSSFSSREFKSAFNGPRGQYGSLADRALGGPSVSKSDSLKIKNEQQTQKLPEVPARVVPTQSVPPKASEVSPPPKTTSPKPLPDTTEPMASKADVPHTAVGGAASEPVVVEQSQSTTLPKPGSPELAPAPAPSASPAAEKPKEDIKTPSPATSPVKSVSSSVRSSPEKPAKKSPTTPASASSSEAGPSNEAPLPSVLKGTSEVETDPVVKKIIVTDEEEEDVGTRKYQRTKSQEFRDYQQEFVLSSTIDFGPLSSPLPSRKPSTTSSHSSAPLKRCRKRNNFPKI